MHRKISHIILFSLCILHFGACSAKNKSFGYEKYGIDAEYFLGLKSLQKNDFKSARNKFNRAIKKGSPLIARKSSEMLCTFGDFREKTAAAKSFSEKYTDDEAMLLSAKVFWETGERNLLIQLTRGIDLKFADNELIRLRLLSTGMRGDANFGTEVVTWFLNRAFSEEHYKFFCYISDSRLTREFKSPIPAEFFEMMEFRSLVYKKDFRAALGLKDEILQIIEQAEASDGEQSKFPRPYMTEQLMSDLGKTLLYGDTDFVKNAKTMQSLAEKYQSTSIEFYCWFYAGRLYESAGDWPKTTEKSFIKAVETAHDGARRDNAIWYVLRTSLKKSVGNCVSLLEKYVSQFSNREYFDDFFDLLSPILLTEGLYGEFGKIYKMVDGLASDEVTAKFAYIYARLIEEKIHTPTAKELDGSSIEEEMNLAFERALNSDTSVYYKMMAAEKLGLSDRKIQELYCQSLRDDFKPVDFELERLLLGYAYFGFPEKIYPEWQKNRKFCLSVEGAVEISKFLSECSTGEDDYYVQSLRIASRTALYTEDKISLELLKYLYPKNYSEWVSKYSEKYGIQQNIMYALIRSESFFDPDIKSVAGAVGLCQLMDATASDIARKLKKSEYSLTNPETSIEFGCYYLSELIRRLDGSCLDAFFAYNAGITRARKWKKNSAAGFGKKEIPEDLFLETLPFSETREYGRKLVSASGMYRWIYGDS